MRYCGNVPWPSGCYFFFFQAEDGIRDLTVTGVQTCALPIWGLAGFCSARSRASSSLTSRGPAQARDRKSTRLNSSHSQISYAVFCLKKKKKDDHSIFETLVAYDIDTRNKVY